MKKKWIVYEVFDNDDYGAEVVPLNDGSDHIHSVDCPCEPKIKDRVLVHNSFDAREYEEEGYKLITLKI